MSHHAARVILSCSFPQAAATAIFLVLGLFLLKDNVGTLQSITPAEVTLSHLQTCMQLEVMSEDWARAQVVLWNDRRGGWGLYTTCMAVVMHLLWMGRAIAIPALAMTGSAALAATRRGAQETVIDGVAIGFIFELDDLFFENLFGERVRRRKSSRRC